MTSSFGAIFMTRFLTKWTFDWFAYILQVETYGSGIWMDQRNLVSWNARMGRRTVPGTWIILHRSAQLRYETLPDFSKGHFSMFGFFCTQYVHNMCAQILIYLWLVILSLNHDWGCFLREKHTQDTKFLIQIQNLWIFHPCLKIILQISTWVAHL